MNGNTQKTCELPNCQVDFNGPVPSSSSRRSCQPTERYHPYQTLTPAMDPMYRSAFQEPTLTHSAYEHPPQMQPPKVSSHLVLNKTLQLTNNTQNYITADPVGCAATLEEEEANLSSLGKDEKYVEKQDLKMGHFFLITDAVLRKVKGENNVIFLSAMPMGNLYDINEDKVNGTVEEEKEEEGERKKKDFATFLKSELERMPIRMIAPTFVTQRFKANPKKLVGAVFCKGYETHCRTWYNLPVFPWMFVSREDIVEYMQMKGLTLLKEVNNEHILEHKQEVKQHFFYNKLKHKLILSLVNKREKDSHVPKEADILYQLFKRENDINRQFVAGMERYYAAK